MVTTRSQKRSAEVKSPGDIFKKIKLGNTNDEIMNFSTDEEEEEEDFAWESDEDYFSSENDDIIAELETKLMDTDPEAYENLKQVQIEIDKNYPNAIKILKMPMRLKDKARLIELYEILKQQQLMGIPMGEEWLELKNKIMILTKRYSENYLQYSEFSKNDISKMKETSSKFKVHDSDFQLKNKILSLDTTENNKKAIYRRYKDLKAIESSRDNDEYSKIKSWIKWAVSIPHQKVKRHPLESTSITEFLKTVMNKLDIELHGMEKVKEQILLFLNTKLLNPEMKGCSLGLIGPPGTGKTSIARYLAEILDVPFEQISFGGVTTPSFLKGHDFTYIGSRPGEIVKCLERMKYSNGILFFDEYEKISDIKEITSLLLHITDPQQNSTFRDNYLSDITIDLSNLWFIYSMNDHPTDGALNDRIHFIDVPGYSLKDKVKIVIDYLLPKNLKNVGLKDKDILISTNIAEYIINKVSSCSDKGVRTIEKAIKDIINKVSFLVNNEGAKDFKISFQIKGKISFPVNLTVDMVNSFCKDHKIIDEKILAMYN